MYLSETEIYKKFFTAVQKRVHMPCSFDEADSDVYNFVSEVTGMVRLIEEMQKEEEK